MPVSKVWHMRVIHIGQRGPSDPPPQCSDGKVFKSCGTACPRTCDNLGELLMCTYNCVIGCFCPSGTVENGDNECVQPSDCPGLTTVSPTTSKSHDHNYSSYADPEYLILNFSISNSSWKVINKQKHYTVDKHHPWSPNKLINIKYQVHTFNVSTRYA